MGLFQPAKKQTAYGKVALFGFPKSGKTFTAAKLAIGLGKTIKTEKPIAFIDTEGGVDYVEPYFRKEGLELVTARTRAFKDHMVALKEAEQTADILIFDSATHSWEDVQESFKRKRNKTSLAFQDWGIIKPTFAELANKVLVCKMHVILCIRAGWEWDYFENDEGKMELHKVGTKMRMEAQFGYEPSLLVEMERVREERKLIHRAWIIGDRADVLDGKSFDNPGFESFKPHFDFILGGEHDPIDIDRTSDDLFNGDTGRPEWKQNKIKKDIALEEIEGMMVKIWPSTGKEDKTAKGDFLEAVFGTRSWTAVTERSLSELEDVASHRHDFYDAYFANPEQGIDATWREALFKEAGEITEPGEQ